MKFIGLFNPFRQQIRTKTIMKNAPIVTVQSSPVLKKFTEQEVESNLLRKPNMLITEPLAFRVSRMKSGMLPVYRQYKNGKTRSVTVVRKIQGDIPAFVKMLSTIIPQDRIRMKAGTSIQVNGNYVAEVREVLTQHKM